MLAEERKGRRRKSIRIWSAGCATGAEPYTISICLLENLYLRDWSISIVGTDISEEAIRDARRGIFKARAVEGISEPQRRRYFLAQDDDRWQVKPEVQTLVRFQKHNLLKPMPPPPFDCIFIRNVLIYFDRESKQLAVGRLIDALAPGGFLVVGPSEGIYAMLDPLERHAPFL